ncbi:MAG: cyclodeaminase/cyclohydrolase family protein [Chloroflexota bacterium]
MDSVSDFLDKLASDQPVPGGGSAAALGAAVAAALVCMVARLTVGRKRYEHVQAEARSIADRADELKSRAERLIQQDADAYQGVATAMALPKSTDGEKQRRSANIQAGLKHAAEPPLEIMRVASEAVMLARELLPIGNTSAVSDLGTAALFGRAAYHAARLNVEINLASVRDAGWVQDTREELAERPAPDATAEAVLLDVARIIQG